ncbi:hypothetical protein KEM54_002298 [Ascosphaera aggregata]|nr:hypothetical protein KEM54_002298 [Ascosphaera aggregata]
MVLKTQDGKSMTAIVLHGAKDLRIEKRPIPIPQGDDLQIAITATGLCGSDLHYYNHGRNGDFIVRHPLCLGHESVGTVLSLGPDVPTTGDSAFQVGDRVALEVGLPCGKCVPCRTGRYNICRTVRFRSSAKTHPHLDGTLMGITTHSAKSVHRLPKRLSDVEGALLEPLAVCVHAMNRSKKLTAEQVQIRQRLGEEPAALIFGAGAMGLLLASALAATQPFTRIVIADIALARLEVAAKLPFGGKIQTHLVPLPPKTSNKPSTPDDDNITAQETASLILQRFHLPEGFTRSYDCTGAPPCIRAAIHATQPGGNLTLVGMGGPSNPNVPLPAAAAKEVDVVGVFRYDGAGYPGAIELMASGKLEGVADCIVTHHAALEQGLRAFELAGKGVDEDGRTVVKVVVIGEKSRL